MKKLLMSLISLAMIFSFVGCTDNFMTERSIKLSARRASVQPLFFVPILKVSFTEPLLEEAELTLEYIDKLIKEKLITKEDFEELLKEKDLTEEGIKKFFEDRIKDAIENERRVQGENKYEDVLTMIEEFGFMSPSKTAIPLGALCPEWAKFPEKVLVVYKTEQKEITAWEKEYEEDILTVAETANVSPSRAKDIVATLRAQGYTITKEEIDTESEVTLLWFNGGWSDTYPLTLNWEVKIEGTETNIIIGYDPRGILEVKPIPDGKRVYVKAGWFDLKDEFKPKSDEAKAFESTIESLRETVEDKEKALQDKEKEFEKEKEGLQEELDELKEKEEDKRDISEITLFDILFENVKIERMWMISGGTGTFLGNMQVREKFSGWQSSWGGYVHNLSGGEKGVILTNAHVAEAAVHFSSYVTEDKEIMWVVYPGYPFVKYTQDSDLYGSPAQLLCYDGQPILSNDYDTAVMVTTAIPDYNQHKAILGNSDRTNQGDKVLMVGNPTLLQKFSTEGIISNKNYSILEDLAFWGIPMAKNIVSKFLNCTMWYDAPLGIAGTSGSGVWALEGSEKGKVIAIHSLGLAKPLSIASDIVDGKELTVESIDTRDVDMSILFEKFAKGHFRELFWDYPYKEAEFKFGADKFSEKYSTFKEAMKHRGLWVEITGMNAGVPINKVKTYLQERGLDPGDFGWDGLTEEYWER